MAACPPDMSAGLLLLRASIIATLGLPTLPPIDSTTVKPILFGQPLSLWMKEPGVSKMSTTIGKQRVNCTLPLTATTQLSDVTDAITATYNAHVSAAHTIHTFSLTRKEYENEYGVVLGYDQGTAGLGKVKKPKAAMDKDGNPLPPPPPHDRMTEVLTVAYIPGVMFGVVQQACVGNTSQLGQLFIPVDKKNTALSFGRTIDLTVKFKIENSSTSPLADAGGKVNLPPAGDLMSFLNSAEVTSSSGKALLASLQAGTAAEAAPPAPTMNGVMAGMEKIDVTPDEEAVVNPWDVSGKIDYNKLIDNFGSQKLTPEILERLEKAVLKKGNVKGLHRFIRRGIFFSHRDFNRILDLVEADKPFYLYTGRGPSSGSMHLGHLLPFMMTQWLQEAFDVPLVIQMTDDEKYLWKGVYIDGDDNLDYFRNLTIQNAKDIIACGFDMKKTFLFSDCDYVGSMYPNIVRIWKAVTYSTARAMFGFEGHSNIGQSAFPAIQAAPSFPSSFPVVLGAARDSELACLIPCAIDQDPYFRMTRDVAHKLTPASHPLGGKPSLFHSKFFPPLQGATGKMSSSDATAAVFLTDSPEEISSKIKTHAFSGGQETSAKQKELGANLDTDVSYQWLTYFMEDDEELKRIGDDYGSGSGEFWATGMVKNRLIELLQGIVANHQSKRLLVTDETVTEWMVERKLEF